jgi:hypothetical protein
MRPVPQPRQRSLSPMIWKVPDRCQTLHAVKGDLLHRATIFYLISMQRLYIALQPRKEFPFHQSTAYSPPKAAKMSASSPTCHSSGRPRHVHPHPACQLQHRAPGRSDQDEHEVGHKVANPPSTYLEAQSMSKILARLLEKTLKQPEKDGRPNLRSRGNHYRKTYSICAA